MFNLNTEKYGALTRVQGMAIPAAGDVSAYVIFQLFECL